MPAERIIYWDACIFIAWLHDEKCHGAGVLEGIDQMAKDINSGKLVLFTSVLTKTEVLEFRMSKRAQDMFSNVFKRKNVAMVAQDERVADLSHDIRNHYAKAGTVLGTPDCVHLATAILNKADCFYTLDGSGKRPRNNDLLPLNGNVAGYSLRILKPNAPQGNLFMSGA